MSKIFCFHHYSPRTRFVSLSADCSDKHLEPIWFCEKCGKVIPRKPSDYARTDKPGSRKAWLKTILKPQSIMLELLAVISFIGMAVLVDQAFKVNPISFIDWSVGTIMVMLALGLFFLGWWLDNLNQKINIHIMVIQGYYTKGEKK